ncbi:MAG: nodulation protein NfeD [Thermovirgaceae bacterium]|nr:nodulation protein NfeD [Thermovirgaceae bacterium]
MKRPLLYILTVVILAAVFAVPPAAPAGTKDPGEIAVIAMGSVEGVVGIALEEHLEVLIKSAEDEGAAILVLVMDTPGGLSSSMRGIIQQIETAPFPIVVWVSPSGARAASAGAFLVQASHVAVMAPGTNIGAAHPVVASGGDIPNADMKRKVLSDFAAQIRALAEQRGRNPEAAEKMVTESVSYTSTEALQAGVIDLVAEDLDDIVSWVNGRTYRTGGGNSQITISGYRVAEFEMNPRLRVLQFVSRPDVAYLFLVAGVFAIVFEVLSPGGFVLGVSGAMLVLFGAYGLRMIPFNWAGIVFLLAGVAVMILDLVVGGIGILSLLGAGAVITGGLILFRVPGGELLNMSYSLMTGAVAVITGFFLLTAWAVWKSMKKRPVSGSDGLVGASVLAISDLSPEGNVLCRGEIWKARVPGGKFLESGSPGAVERVEGLTLVVRPSDKGRDDLDKDTGGKPQ